MDLKRVKTVMIIILIAINAFFAYNIVSDHYEQNYIDETTVVNAIEILSRDGINVDFESFPKKRISLPIYESRFFDSYNENVVSLLSGSAVERTFSLPGGMRFVSQNGDTVEISGRFGVVFLSCNADRYMAYSKIIDDALSSNGSAVSSAVLEDIKQKLVSDVSASVGYAKMGAECVSVHYDPASEYHVAVFSQTMDGVQIHGHDMFCVIEGENLLYMEGLWSFLPTDEKYSSQLTDQINILFMEKKRLEDESKELEENDAFDIERESVRIESIDNVYCTYLNEDRMGLYFIPAWRITYDDGTESVYDAQSGTRYVKNAAN